MSSGSIVVPDSDRATCPFCDYLSGAREYTILSRTDRVAVLVTREQRGEPHLLVIPVRHCETILDLTDDEAALLMVTARDVARAIDAEYGRPGIAIWQNNGSPAHQAIGHFHIHVAGTLDEGGTAWGEVTELPLSATDEVAARLRPLMAVGA